MPSRTKSQAAPAVFFERQLHPEPPLTLETGRRLCSAARLIFSKQPWQLLEETDLVFVDGGPQAPLLACSTIGQMGQVFAVITYVGVEGYQFFRRLSSDESMTSDDFLSEQNAISVEFAGRRELTKLDRELIAAAGPEWAKSPAVPLFRASRPGYHPWYPNESEAGLLVECLDAMNWFLEHLPDDPVSEYWQGKETYPKLSRNGRDGFEIEMATAPRAPIAMPRIPPLDTGRVRRVLSAGGGEQGILEVDEFFCAAKVGRAHERKSCVRVGLAIDAGTGIAFPPEVAAPDVAPGELLVEVTLKALESGAPLPVAIHVRRREAKLVLEQLADALDAKVVVKRSLPALDGAKRSMLRMMRES